MMAHPTRFAVPLLVRNKAAGAIGHAHFERKISVRGVTKEAGLSLSANLCWFCLRRSIRALPGNNTICSPHGSLFANFLLVLSSAINPCTLRQQHHLQPPRIVICKPLLVLSAAINSWNPRQHHLQHPRRRGGALLLTLTQVRYCLDAYRVIGWQGGLPLVGGEETFSNAGSVGGRVVVCTRLSGEVVADSTNSTETDTASCSCSCSCPCSSLGSSSPGGMLPLSSPRISNEIS